MRGHMDQYDPYGESSTDYVKENPVLQTSNEFFKGVSKHVDKTDLNDTIYLISHQLLEKSLNKTF